MVPRALVPLAAGFEEMEAVIVIDVLRRGNVEVVVAGLDGSGPVLGSRYISVSADVPLRSVLSQSFDAIVLPGGKDGTDALCAHDELVHAVRQHAGEGKLTAAVCAAPLVLLRAGLAVGHAVTGHPSIWDELRAAGAHVSDGRLVRDGAILTSQGPGTSMEFALAVLAELCGSERASDVAAGMRH